MNDSASPTHDGRALALTRRVECLRQIELESGCVEGVAERTLGRGGAFEELDGRYRVALAEGDEPLAGEAARRRLPAELGSLGGRHRLDHPGEQLALSRRVERADEREGADDPRPAAADRVDRVGDHAAELLSPASEVRPRSEGARHRDDPLRLGARERQQRGSRRCRSAVARSPRRVASCAVRPTSTKRAVGSVREFARLWRSRRPRPSGRRGGAASTRATARRGPIAGGRGRYVSLPATTSWIRTTRRRGYALPRSRGSWPARGTPLPPPRSRSRRRRSRGSLRGQAWCTSRHRVCGGDVDPAVDRAERVPDALGDGERVLRELERVRLAAEHRELRPSRERPRTLGRVGLALERVDGFGRDGERLVPPCREPERARPPAERVREERHVLGTRQGDRQVEMAEGVVGPADRRREAPEQELRRGTGVVVRCELGRAVDVVGARRRRTRAGGRRARRSRGARTRAVRRRGSSPRTPAPPA